MIYLCILKKISIKQSKRLREYREVRKQYLLYNQYCFCGAMATDIHHKRGRIGNLLIDSNYFLSVCRGCHKKIEENPKWAKENGYSLNRYGEN